VRRHGCWLRLRVRRRGDVGGDRVQVRVGQRREGAADAQVELVLGQPSLDERRLECLGCLLAVGL
jgi:hypothetical protein